MPLALDGSGVLRKMGVNPLPVGTLDELRQEGIDSDKVGSCAPPSPGVRGCALWTECRFNQPRYGGFKGTRGPKYIGYYLQTSDGEVKEDLCTCHSFTRTLQGRMDHGLMLRQQGKPHELIRIIAQEGEEIVTRVGVPIDPTLCETPTNNKIAYHYVKERLKVPKYPRPGENEQISYDQELMARERLRREAEEAVERDAASASMRVKYDADPEPIAAVAAQPVIPEPPLVEPVTATAVIAEPVRKKA